MLSLELLQEQSSGTSELLRLLETDPSPDVRRTVLSKIIISDQTLPGEWGERERVLERGMADCTAFRLQFELTVEVFALVFCFLLPPPPPYSPPHSPSLLSTLPPPLLPFISPIAIIRRTRDVKDVIRRDAFLLLSEKCNIRNFTIQQRIQLLNDGLNDRQGRTHTHTHTHTVEHVVIFHCHASLTHRVCWFSLQE